jgi:V/A-type H+-transporting ATPase subunit I
MSIVPLRRVTLVGCLPDKEAALDGLQTMGVMHLIPLRADPSLQPADPAERHRARTAFRHLVDAPEQALPYRADHAFDLDATVDLIMANRRRLRELGDRRDDLAARIADLAPWGEFTLPPLDWLGGLRLWLYPLPIKERKALDRLELPWAIVGSGPTTRHVVVISRDEPPADALPVRRIRAGLGPLSRLQADFETTDIEIDKAQAERKSLTRWRVRLGAALAAADDRDALREAAAHTLDADAVFAVQGWAPEESVPALETFAAERGAALLAEAPGRRDKPPTLLRVPEGAAVATDLTNFYTSPGYRDWDPSLIVFVSFAIFFAMIMADAGYAALMGLGTLIFWRRMGKSETGRRARTLLAALAGAGVAFGALVGSYFGTPPPAASFLARLDLLDLNDFRTMMLLSVGVGAVHLTVAHLVVAWRARGTARMLAPLGWIAVIWAGMAVALGGEDLRRSALAVIAAGLVAVFLGSAAGADDDAGTGSPGAARRVIAGLIGLLGVTKKFGDLLSYLRLFALGLASASLAATFNDLAAGIRATVPGVGLLFALLILVFGHGITFLLGIMSGVVHGLRLNFIEFFGWGLTEEGYPFRSFKKKEIPA